MHRSLRELEIDGRYDGYYDKTIFSQFTSIRRIKLITPSPPIVEVLPVWLESLEDPLQNLSIMFNLVGRLLVIILFIY